jgi:hypothetical protein
MRLINAGGDLTSFHSDRISVSLIKHTKKRTVSFKCQLIFESQFNLLLYTTQDVGQIADKLRKVEGTGLNMEN